MTKTQITFIRNRIHTIPQPAMDVEFVEIVGALSKDREIRVLAASGSALLSVNDR